jgi:hypothetical protein
MNVTKACDFTALNRAGLNLQAVFDLDQLPAKIVAQLFNGDAPVSRYRQLILIGHAGKTLWDAVKASGIHSENPIDDFSVLAVEHWFAAQFAGKVHAIVYPGNTPLGLQALGALAGWHHTSPLRVGICAEWGTWYAYRVALLTDTALPPSRPACSESPCTTCRERFCIASCPAGALDDGELRLEKCIGYRKSSESRCKATCVARVSCPVGSTHRYRDDQLRHAYTISLQAIEQHGRCVDARAPGAHAMTEKGASGCMVEIT